MPLISNIGELIQRDIEKSATELGSAVVPIVAFNEQGSLVVLGSATCFEVAGRKYICTAEHVLSDWNFSDLHLVVFEKLLSIKHGQFFCSKELDVAIADVTDFVDGTLQTYSFLAEHQVYKFLPSTKSISGVVGFPTSKSKYNKQTKRLSTNKYLISCIVDGFDGNEVVIRFNKNRFAKLGSKVSIKSPDPYGMSGGAIFSSEVIDSAATPATAKLLGIATKWCQDEMTIRGTTLPSIINVINSTF